MVMIMCTHSHTHTHARTHMRARTHKHTQTYILMYLHNILSCWGNVLGSSAQAGLHIHTDSSKAHTMSTLLRHRRSVTVAYVTTTELEILACGMFTVRFSCLYILSGVGNRPTFQQRLKDGVRGVTRRRFLLLDLTQHWRKVSFRNDRRQSRLVVSPCWHGLRNTRAGHTLSSAVGDMDAHPLPLLNVLLSLKYTQMLHQARFPNASSVSKLTQKYTHSRADARA